MRRQFAQQTEVVRCADQPPAEMPPPDAVHQNSTGERMIRVHQPLSQFQPTAVLSIKFRFRSTGQHSRHAARNDITQLQRVTANVNRHIDDGILGDAHRRRHLGSRLRELSQLVPQSFEFRFGLVRVLVFQRGGGRFTSRKQRFDGSVRLVHQRLKNLFLLSGLYLVSGFQSECRGRGSRILVPASQLGVFLHGPSAFEDPGQSIVVRRLDRIELVVVASRAAQRQPENRAAHRVDLLVDDVHPHLGFVRLGQDFRTNAQEAGRDQVLVPLSLVARLKQIASELLD